MIFRIVSVCLAAVLMLLFVVPVVWKLKDLSLTVVVLIGVAMMAWNLWETIREDD